MLDENVDAQAELADVKKKSTKAATSSNKVLAERNAPNSHASSPSNDSPKPQTTVAKVASQKSGRSKRGKKPHSEEVREDSRCTTPVPASPTKKRLPEEQVQAFLQNYDLEAQARVSRLRASLEMAVQSSITRMRLAVERIPRAVRELRLSEFIDEYGADIHAFMGRAPVQHLQDTQKEWDQIKEERSPIKPKRSKKEEDAATKAERHTKAARTANAAAPSSSSRTTAAAAGRKKTTRSAARSSSSRATSVAATSPPPPAATTRPAPSLATFQPDLPKQALQTPKPQPRMARPGEVIQWQSINGSPICGIIGEDGVVRPVTFA